ncbi:XRE family transcriptional regulator [Colwellia sp. RE-S-Sl-9]
MEPVTIINPYMEPCQMNYGKKIKILRESMNKTQAEFSEITGISLSTLKKIEGGFSNVGVSVIDKIITTPTLEEHVLWFMTGKGNLEVEPTKNVIEGHIKLPFYEVKASAGEGLLVEAEEQTHLISFEPKWLNKEIGVNPNDVFLMLVDGDSMYPTLKNGAMIMVNKHFNGLNDGIYVIRHDNNLLVKRLQVLPKGIIKVKSDNHMYEPWEINKEDINGTDIELIGRVVWSGQRM